MNQVMKVLDLGCGNKKREGVVGIDVKKGVAANVIDGLNVLPCPLDDSLSDEFDFSNTLGHSGEVICATLEIYRNGVRVNSLPAVDSSVTNVIATSCKKDRVYLKGSKWEMPNPL